MPIKSGYINNMAEMKRTESYDTVDEKSNKSGLNADTTKSNNASQLFDERPICGLKK